MVLVSAIRVRIGEGHSMLSAIHEAANASLRTIVMTALVASVGFVPMAVSTGVGAEVQRPLATVVIGGVMTSMLMTLFILPVLYSSFARRERAAAVDKDDENPAIPGEDAAELDPEECVAVC
jgi:cobalt-zinc-cadmium resistance protein CzcA